MNNHSQSDIQIDRGTAVSVDGVVFRYSRNQSSVVHIDAWQVNRQEKVFLYGPSGSGKTTLLSLLSGIHTPQQGQIHLLNQPFSRQKGAQRDRFRARHIGVIYQQFNLIPWFTVRDNIALAHHFAKKVSDPERLTERIVNLLERLTLSPGLLKRQTAALSVGQQQRVAIARALINAPELIIADEPTSALDTDARDDFMQLLLDCVREHCATLIFVSHDRALAKHFDHQVDLQELNRAAWGSPC